MKDFFFGALFLACGIGVVVGMLWGIIWGWQYFKVFSAEQSGKAELKQQEWAKQVLVEQAKAQNEAATLNAEARIKQAGAEAEAEIVRASGAAEANKILAESLKGKEEYLRYLWINKMDGNQIIYIPTEAGMPILEAGKR